MAAEDKLALTQRTWRTTPEGPISQHSGKEPGQSLTHNETSFTHSLRHNHDTTKMEVMDTVSTVFVTVRDLIRVIEDDGWRLDPRVSDNDFRQFRHPRKHGTVTIVGELELFIAPNALRHVLQTARLDHPEGLYPPVG